MIMLQKNIIVLLFGFISGFTVLITGHVLNFWLAKNKISSELIGLLSIVSIPYAFNFLWSPIVDRYKIPYLSKNFGHRYSWIIILHFFMAIFIFLLSLCDPSQNIGILCFFALLVSFFSSTKDSVLNAWRSEILEGENQGAATGLYIFGYRIGLLISSSLTIYISSFISWSLIYKAYSLIVLFFPISFYFFYKCEGGQSALRASDFSFKSFINYILLEYRGIASFILILIFLITYKLPDNLLNSMINIFVLEFHYNEYEIASIGKFLGFFGSIIGGFIAGYFLDKTTIKKTLLIFGTLHSFSLLFFLSLIYFGHNLIIYILVIGFQSITGGMAMASYISYITSLCRGEYRATQYSVLSSMMGLSRSLFPVISGYIVKYFGWTKFYIIIFIVSIPSIIMIKYLYSNQKENDR
jgi:PAT family beta-lactamase induction signal transducer AmpG